MKKLSRMEYVTRPLVATLLSLSLVILLASGAQAAVNCATCHGVLAGDGVTGLDAHPVDTPPGSLPTYRNITTGAVKGNHNTHSTASMNASVCIKCHGAAAASYTAKHAVLNHYSIQVAPTVNYNKGTGVVTAFPQTDSPVLGNCSNVNCHFNTVTPQWGSAPLGAASLSNTCGTCHNALPATGSHNVHLATVGNTLSGCAQCHADHGAAAKPFQHATSAGRRPIALASSFGYAGSDNNYLVATGRTYGSCATASCHADPYGTGKIATPAWGNSAGCAACHTGANVITATGPATGSHALHGSVANCISCHNSGTTSTVAPATGHIDGNIDVVNVGYPVDKVKGSAASSCSTATCHGSASPVWGANTTNDSCTKCHGTGSATVTAATRHLLAPNDPAVAATVDKVSPIAKVGAHQTHLQLFNGLSAQGTEDDRCTTCHGPLPVSTLHANGSAVPVFQGLAKTFNSGAGTYATSYTGGSCSVYCHNPAGSTLNAANAGTGIAPSWTNAAYLGDTRKTQANCGVCHKSPGDAGFTSTTTHTPDITQDCTGCHGHNGAAGGAVGQQHMDGIKYGSGNCDSCHGYQAGSWAAAPAINAEGKGAHESHITYLTTKRFGTTITLTPTSDQYASAATTWTNVCGICHDNSSALHKNGTVNVALSTNQAYVFGPTGTIATYSGLPGRLKANDKTCSNISCHYFTTPVWSTY